MFKKKELERGATGAFLLIGVEESDFRMFDPDLEKFIANELSGLGFELIGLEFDSHNNPKVLRVYADVLVAKVSEISAGVNNRITLDDCSKISYHLNKVLSVMPNLQVSNYSLEVSSPGLERRLFNLLQMEQYLGTIIKLRLVSPLDGKGNFVGILRSVDHVLNGVFIEVDGQNLYFDVDNIAKANLVYRKL